MAGNPRNAKGTFVCAKVIIVSAAVSAAAAVAPTRSAATSDVSVKDNLGRFSIGRPGDGESRYRLGFDVLRCSLDAAADSMPPAGTHVS